MKLSIITINLNNAQDLVRTIESVKSQTFRDFEFIIIDGGSSDGSVEIIKQIEDKLAFWVSEPDRGIFNAMNIGLKKATGKYVLMLNAGDVLYDYDTLSIVFSLENHNEDILYGDVKLESRGKIWGEKIFANEITFNFFRKKTLSHQAAFIKRDLHDRIGLYDEDLRFSSDWKFFILAFCKFNCSYKYLRQYIAICNCDGLTWNPKNFPLMKDEINRVLKADFPRFISDYEYFDRLTAKSKTVSNLFISLRNKLMSKINIKKI